MKETTTWKIQLGFGVILLLYVFMAQSVMDKVNEKSAYIFLGFAGMTLVWSIREVLGAFAKRYKCIKRKNEIQMQTL